VVIAVVVSEKVKLEGVLIPEKALYAGLFRILDGFVKGGLHCFIDCDWHGTRFLGWGVTFFRILLANSATRTPRE
jgi:hypothetical protein